MTGISQKTGMFKTYEKMLPLTVWQIRKSLTILSVIEDVEKEYLPAGSANGYSLTWHRLWQCDFPLRYIVEWQFFKGTTSFIFTQCHYLSSVLTFAQMCKRIVGKIPPNIAQNKAESSNHTHGHYVLHYHMFIVKEKKIECDFRMSVGKQTLQSYQISILCTHLFDILHDKAVHKSTSAYRSQILRKSSSVIDLWAVLATFLMKHHFYSKDWPTMVFRTSLFGWYFLENQQNEPVTSRKQLIVFVANVKIQDLNRELGTCKICIFLCDLESFPILKGFFWKDKISNDFSGYDLKMLYNEWNVPTFGGSAQFSELIVSKCLMYDVIISCRSKRSIQDARWTNGF